MLTFIAFIWDEENSQQLLAAETFTRDMSLKPFPWHQVLAAQGLAVFCADDAHRFNVPCLLANDGGVVLGTLFARDNLNSPRRVRSLNEHESARILKSRGRDLINSYWGQYVAFLVDPCTGRVLVLKDPTGRLPCFAATSRGIMVLFSSVSTCLQLGIGNFRLDHQYLRQRVATGAGIGQETGLLGVSEFYGGMCMEFCKGRISSSFYWPSTNDLETVHDDVVLLAEEIRSTTLACTRAWASGYDNVLLRLSGGFDSSVVLAALRGVEARKRVTCITYYEAKGRSDERPWARLAVRNTACQLYEHVRDAHLDLRALLNMSAFPKPPPDLSFLETRDIERKLAENLGVTAVFSGDGGDCIFGSYSARFAVRDFVRRYGLSSGLFRLASQLALHQDVVVWRVLADGISHGFLKPANPDVGRLHEARQLVCDDVFDAGVATLHLHRHPWFTVDRVTEGAAAMLSCLMNRDSFYDPLSGPLDTGSELVTPLLSQPLVELCLRVPSFVLFDGRDRGLVRRAFVKEVPPEILARSWKDRVQGFPEQVFNHNHEFLRELLLDGVLVREHLLDRRRVERSLSARLGQNDVHVGELLDHAMTEAWARCWTITGVRHHFEARTAAACLP
jgi:asparagine synthase (glutamine-hydrolysing)